MLRTNGPAAAVEIPPELARALCGKTGRSELLGLAGRPIDKDHSRMFASWLFVQQRRAGPALIDFGSALDKHPGGLPAQVEGKS